VEQKPKDIKLILAEAMERKTAHERAAYLDDVCAGDTALREEVDSLLAQEKVIGDFLETPPLGENPVLADSLVSEGPGTVIGRYKLLERIGEGGMAVVYMAEQEQPIRRKVALKIIKLGMDTRQVIARFEAERQALAMMDHPNIAKVFDAGATETGRPYFVMELVTGVSITQHCDQNRLTTKERLALFIQVCNAVQHAHQKGVIHRDIKPSNVMVTHHDGKPVPKVIDFGIAKATNQRLTEKTLFTRYAHLVGTPAYMSPEQAELSDVDIDTRTDIYSLGVLLYELLTGTTPFSEEELRKAGYVEMQRVIREKEPLKPSTKLTTLGETSTEIARRRNSTPDQLRKVIRGDLDWIAMKALEKDRTRRYETAHALVEDITRHIQDQPVLAGPPSTVYCLGKFLRKNCVAALAVGSIVLAITVGLVLSLFFYGRAEDRAREATRQADIAEKQRLRAEEQELLTRRHLSAANMRHASAEFSLGNTIRAADVLRAQIPEGPEQDLRGFEWYYLWAQCHPDCYEIKGRSTRAGFAPDGKSVAIGGVSDTVKIIDTATGKVLKRLPIDGEDVFAIAFSPDGEHLAIRGDGWLRVWSVPSYETVSTLHNDLLILETLNLSRDQTYRLQHLGQNPATARVYLGGQTLSFSMDGKDLAVGAREGWVVILGVDDGEELARFKAYDQQVASLAFLTDGQTLLTLGASKSGPLKIWDVTQVDAPVLRSEQSFPEAAALSSDGRLLLACAQAQGKYELDFFETTSEEMVANVAVRDRPFPSGVALGSEFAAVKFVGGNVGLYEVHTGRVRTYLANHLNPLAFSPDGRTIVLSDGEETSILNLGQVENPRRLDMPSQGDWMEKLRLGLPQNEHFQTRLSVRSRGCISLLSDGRELTACPGLDVTVTEHGERTIEHTVFWVEDGRTLDLLGRGDPRWMSFSPDGKFLAMVGAEGSVILWSLESHEEVSRFQSLRVVLPNPDDFPMCPPERREDRVDSMRARFWGPVDFLADGESLIAATYRGEVVIWDVATGGEVNQFDCGMTIHDIAPAPDGETVALAGLEDVFLWRAKTSEKLATIHVPIPPFSPFAFTPPGGFPKHPSVTFSPDGNTLVIGCPDGTIRFWDMKLQAERFSLKQPEGPVDFLAFGSDGKTLISGYETVIYLWRGYERGSTIGPEESTGSAVSESVSVP